MTSEGIFNFSVDPIFKNKKKFLKDVLIKNVDEKYYINEDEILKDFYENYKNV